MTWYGMGDKGKAQRAGRARGMEEGEIAANVNVGRERGRTPSSEATSETSLAEKPMDAASQPDCRSCKRSLSALTGNGTDVNSVGTAKKPTISEVSEQAIAGMERGLECERDPYFA